MSSRIVISKDFGAKMFTLCMLLFAGSALHAQSVKSLTLTSPNGNEVWQAGSTHYISWTSAGLKRVKLEYSTNGLTWNSITTSSDAAKGFYTWVLPTLKSKSYVVRISDSSNTSLNDTSDARFEIASDTLIFPNTQWKYFDKGISPGTNWKDSLFIDTAFGTGLAEFGYGDGDETTLINACGTIAQMPACNNKYISTYFRKKFNIPNLDQFNGFSLQVVRDDGAVVYINGNEVWRNNLPAGIITNSTQALTAISGPDESAYQIVTIPVTYFVNGTNTIAVEIHQESGTSSDVSFNLCLKGIQAPFNPVVLTAPNGGEQWIPGSVQKITWQAQSRVNRVKVEYSINGGAVWNTISNAVYGFIGYVWWLVPNTPSTNVLVKISDTSNVMFFDTSQARFTITTPLAPVLLRGPYLQMVTQTTANLRWRTDVPVQSRVRFGTIPSALTTFTDDTALVTEHEIKITGLSPYTTYYYSIGDIISTLQGDSNNYFRTLPPAGKKDQLLRIGVIGDCGNASTNQINVRNSLQNYLGSNYMDSWILLGDNAYYSGSDNEYQAQFFNIYKDNFLKQNPLWPAPGNHDYAGSPTSQNDHNMPYYKMFTMPEGGEAGGIPSGTEAYYSFDIGNVHFLSLDSYGKENNATRLYDTLGAQVNWIKQDLAANQNKQWIVAYWHHPPYTKGSHNSDIMPELVSIRENFIRILERYGVDLILCGHSHVYERSKLMQGHYGTENTFSAPMHHLDSSSGRYDGSTNSCPYKKDPITNKGTVYVVAGSAGQLGGASLGYPHDAMYYSNTTNGGSMVLEVLGNRLDAKWICADGVVRDQFTMMKDVNVKRMITANAGDTVELTASYVGNYSWNLPGQTKRTTKVVANGGHHVYTVTDNFSCLKDSFVISGTALPVKWNNVKAWHEGNNVKVYWQTAQEANSTSFEVERSSDGRNFIVIGRVMAAGNSSVAKNYEYIDQQPLNEALVYYRIRQIDHNGYSEYSKTVSVNRNSAAIDYDISIVPNPGYGTEMRIRLNNRQSASAQLLLTDVSGMSMVNRDIELTDNFQYFLPELKPGFYFLNLNMEGTVITRKLIIK